MRDYEKKALYDKLCRTLTEFEEMEIEAEDLYPILCEIQVKWEELFA